MHSHFDESTDFWLVISDASPATLVYSTSDDKDLVSSLDILSAETMNLEGLKYIPNSGGLTP